MRAGDGYRRASNSGSRSGLGLDLEDLPAAIHAGLQVDVVRAAQFARILVLDVGRLLQRVRRAAHAAPGRRGFSFRNSHETLLRAPGRQRQRVAMRLGSAAYRGRGHRMPEAENWQSIDVSLTIYNNNI